MRLSLIVLAGLAGAGCKKESSQAGGQPLAAASTDPLWAFAPPNASMALVVADGVLDPLHGGALKALAALEKAPGGAEIAGMIRQRTRTPAGDLLDRKRLGELGVDLGKGAALFRGGGATVAVLPVADGKKFAAAIGAPVDGDVASLGPLRCKTVSGRYLCADSPQALELAARGGGQAQAASLPRELRGHLELYVSAEEMDASDMPLDAPGGLRAAAIFERGALTARLHVIGKPRPPLDAARASKSALAAGVADQQPTGLVMVNAAGLWKLAQARATDSGETRMPGGVTEKDLIHALSGELIGYALPGTPLRGMAKVGLANQAPLQKLVAACGEIGAAAPTGVSLSKSGEKCAVSIDPAALGAPMTGIGKLTFEVWVESGALVIGLGDYAAKSSARPGLAPFARELLDGAWTVAAWGQGTMAGGPLLADKAQLDMIRKTDPTGGLAVWALHHLSEVGVAMRVADDGVHGMFRFRTLWSNPDEVVAAVEEKVAAFAAGDDGAIAALADVAAKYPDSPYARDLQAGAGGLAAPIAAVGMLAAIAIPSFVKYTRKSKSTEARAHLHKLYAGARAHWFDPAGSPGSIQATAPSFPAPSAGPTPPLGTCCAQGGTCAPDLALWEGEPWRSLHFSLDDPHHYSYEYKVNVGQPGALDGSNNFTVLAYGDLDCDGTYSTFSMKGVVDEANADGPAGSAEMSQVNETE